MLTMPSRRWSRPICISENMLVIGRRHSYFRSAQSPPSNCLGVPGARRELLSSPRSGTCRRTYTLHYGLSETRTSSSTQSNCLRTPPAGNQECAMTVSLVSMDTWTVPLLVLSCYVCTCNMLCLLTIAQVHRTLPQAIRYSMWYHPLSNIGDRKVCHLCWIPGLHLARHVVLY